MKAFFICGTGRCGTTITKRILSKHSQIFSFDDEARFIDHPHGIIDLYVALTTQWNPFRVDAALYNFERMVLTKKSKSLFQIYKKLVKHQGKRKFFTMISPPPYMSLDIKDYALLIRKHIQNLKNDLEFIQYRGCWPGMHGLITNPQMKVSTEVNEQVVIKAINKFLTNLIEDILESKSADIWLDDTIYLHLHAKEILKFLPSAKFIHLYRDPRDVIASYRTRLWGPSDYVYGAKMYRAIMQKWDLIKKQIPKESYTEICFEYLLAEPQKTLQEISRFMQIPWDSTCFDIKLLDFSKSNLGRWKRELSEIDLFNVEPFIKPYLEYYGYNKILEATTEVKVKKEHRYTKKELPGKCESI